MHLLHLEALPPGTTTAALFRLLVTTGGVPKDGVGQIRIDRTAATVKLPEHLLYRAAKTLDGATLGHRAIRCWAQGGNSNQAGDEHFAKLLRLLEMETLAERADLDTQRTKWADAPPVGWALKGLIAREPDDGLADCVTVTLTPKRVGARLAPTRLGVGSPVALLDEKEPQNTACCGVVSAIDDYHSKESTLACQKVRRLIELGVEAKQIAVICAYAAQASHTRQELGLPEVEVDTVDGFQGREKDVVVISLVRSNREGQIGFLADTRRMNVALTRGRRKLVVIGDSATIAHDAFYKRLIDYFEQIDAYHSVWEEE